MKKLFVTTIVFGIFIMVGLLFYGANIESSSEAPQSTQATTEQVPNCTDVPDLDLAGQRALGLIITNRQLLSIKLGVEKNFSPPGGHLVRDEAPKAALRRELLEELNLTIPEDKFASYEVTCSLNNDATVRTYYYLVDVPEQTINIASKSDTIKWVDYSFAKGKKADQELKQALFHLKKDNLID